MFVCYCVRCYACDKTELEHCPGGGLRGDTAEMGGMFWGGGYALNLLH